MKKKSADKNKRCVYSGKIVRGKEVVRTDYVVEYVKKLGFEVKPARNIVEIKKFILLCYLAFTGGWIIRWI